MKTFWMVIFVTSGVALGQTVEDEERACPVGYFYGGEVEFMEFARGEHWIQGERTPVYSCYKVVAGTFNWVEANIKCMEYDGQLVSVNNDYEDLILTGELFTRKAFFNQETQEMEFPSGPVITSGVSLSPSNWTWFGEGESMDNKTTEMMNGLAVDNSSSTLCVSVQWTEGEELEYRVQPCVDQVTMALCEVRAYTQTWYVWFTINWIQVLFLFTLVLLIISSCVTMHIWVSRPAHRAAQQGRIPRPPPYTPQDIPATTTTTTTSNANKYAEKGKEILGKVIFYRKSDDKQKLTEDA